jgi:regulator of replication initiation timing
MRRSMKVKKVEVSLVCFALVIAAAVPVALLRTRTYSLGYELGRLKAQEKKLIQENVALLAELNETKYAIREKYISPTNAAPKQLNKIDSRQLALPEFDHVIQGYGDETK